MVDLGMGLSWFGGCLGVCFEFIFGLGYFGFLSNFPSLLMF